MKDYFLHLLRRDLLHERTVVRAQFVYVLLFGLAPAIVSGQPTRRTDAHDSRAGIRSMSDDTITRRGVDVHLADKVRRDLAAIVREVPNTGVEIIDNTRSSSGNVRGNIFVKINGSGTALRKEFVVIGTRYVEPIDKSGEYVDASVQQEDRVIAMESRVSALLITTRELLAQPPRRSVLISFLGASVDRQARSAEDLIANSPVALSRIISMLNIEYIDPREAGSVKVSGIGSSIGFDKIVENANRKYQLTLVKFRDARGPGDQSLFNNKQIPVLSFASARLQLVPDSQQRPIGNAHQAIAALVSLIARDIGDQANAPVFSAPVGISTVLIDRPPSPVYIGVVPAAIMSDSGKGVRVAGVRQYSPAARAGIRRGDRIKALDGVYVTDIFGYSNLVRRLRPEKKIAILIERDGNVRTIDVVPLKRAL